MRMFPPSRTSDLYHGRRRSTRRRRPRRATALVTYLYRRPVPPALARSELRAGDGLRHERVDDARVRSRYSERGVASAPYDCGWRRPPAE
ncbi:hypothetical protein EVAR_23926_1 [Eumeta japonica]|uniref:Uncharacterized protein n=1 Tax=Eumeta variegata TaxID=151549 RepID=A0A4C1V2K3_EUMVA|nr:hypothetical protein EVAR_23926_1 [Eumeta japonica]